MRHSPGVLPLGTGVGLVAGSKLGRYVIESLIGAGGMGAVYCAHDPDLGRRVALKVLHARTSDGAEGGARLLREAQAIARLQHPNVVAVHDVGSVDGQVFIAMEHVEGRTLRRWLEEEPRSWREVCDVFVQAGTGLAAAHAAGLVHRDFKPENVLIGDDRRVRVLDFGLARSAADPAPAPAGEPLPELLSSQLTVTGSAAGTPLYMAPEQQEGDQVDARADQFSFAVALWEALYADPAAGAATWQERRARVVLVGMGLAPAEPARAGAGADRPPSAVAEALARALRPDPAERHPSMDALLDALRVGPPPPKRRTTLLLGIGVAVAAGTAAVAIGLARRGDRAPLETPAAPIETRFASVPASRITTDGVAREPAISPDGTTLAFIRVNDLVFRDVATGRETIAGNQLNRPVWSKDSSRVLALRGDEAIVEGEVQVIPRDGGPHQTLPEPCSTWDWLPDGRVACVPPGSKKVLVRDLGGELVDTVDLSGIQAERREQIRYSTGGALLALASDKAGMSIWVLPRVGARPTRVASEAMISSAVWTGSGDGILYLRKRAESSELVHLAIDPRTGAAGSATVVLAESANDAISVSADGRTLVYTRVREDADLWWTEFDAAAEALPSPRRLPTAPGIKELGNLSPDGRRVAYASGLSPEKTEIAVQELEGGTPPRVLTSLGRSSSIPVWSPDGTRIAFVAPDGDVMRIWIIDANGGTPRMLPRSIVTRHRQIVWAPARRILYLEPGERQVHWLDPDTGADEPVLDPEDARKMRVYWPVIEPGERRIAFISGTEEPGSDGIYLWSGGRLERLPAREREWVFAWPRDDRFVYTISGLRLDPRTGRFRPREVSVQPLRGGEPRRMKLPDVGPVWGISLSADQRRVVLETRESSSDVWMARLPLE